MLDLWREARGKVLRKRWDGLMQRVDHIDDPARVACLDYIKWKFEPLSQRYGKASKADRKRISRQVRKVSGQLTS